MSGRQIGKAIKTHVSYNVIIIIFEVFKYIYIIVFLKIILMYHKHYFILLCL
jgi:hypothetical protein